MNVPPGAPTDRLQPRIHSTVSTQFAWRAPGLLLPAAPCSFTAYYRAHRAHTPRHAGWLSIKYAFQGYEDYLVNRDRIRVNPAAFLILNHGDEYACEIDALEPSESFSVFFDAAFAEDVLRALSSTDDRLLDNSRGDDAPVYFRPHLFEAEPGLVDMITVIRDRCLRGAAEGGWLEERFHDLLEEMLRVRRGSLREEVGVAAVRSATRAEIYERLCRARDFMHAEYGRPLPLREIAREACLSPHHFLRLHQSAFGQSPHQFLTSLRLRHAARLLQTTGLTVTEVCLAVGFESLPTFSTLFRRRMGRSPSQFRKMQ
jgi:AraC-like DNA-binding protein